MKAGALHRVRSLQSVAGTVAALVALASTGLALTRLVFPTDTPPEGLQTVTQTTTVATTGPAPTTGTGVRAEASQTSGLYTFLGVAFGGAVVLVLVGGGVRLARQRLRQRVDREIAGVGDGGGNITTVTQTVIRRPGVTEDDHELVSQLVRRRFVQEAVSEVRDLTLFDFLPPRPRTVKRAWNDFLLRAGLATQRGLLAGDSPVQPHHLCKWVVLSYAWPDVARTLEDVPSLIDELEEADGASGLESALTAAGIHVRRPELFCTFIRTEPRIGPVFDDLTRLKHR
jgi:hypothetical protein